MVVMGSTPVVMASWWAMIEPSPPPERARDACAALRGGTSPSRSMSGKDVMVTLIFDQCMHCLERYTQISVVLFSKKIILDQSLNLSVCMCRNILISF